MTTRNIDKQCYIFNNRLPNKRPGYLDIKFINFTPGKIDEVLKMTKNKKTAGLDIEPLRHVTLAFN